MWIRQQRYAEIHGVQPRTVARWIASKQLKSKKVGGSVFIWEGEYEPTQLERIERKIDDIRHATLSKTNT